MPESCSNADSSRQHGDDIGTVASKCCRKLAVLAEASTLTGLSPLAKTVFTILLTRYHNTETGRCDPGVERLCADTERSRSQVLAAVGELKIAGLTTVTQRGRTSPQYNFPALDSLYAVRYSGPLEEDGVRNTGPLECHAVRNIGPQELGVRNIGPKPLNLDSESIRESEREALSQAQVENVFEGQPVSPPCPSAAPPVASPPLASEIVVVAPAIAISDADRAWARAQGMTDYEVDIEAEALRSWLAEDPRRRMALRRWLSRYLQHVAGNPDRRHRPPRAPKRTVIEAARDLTAHIQSRIAVAEAAETALGHIRSAEEDGTARRVVRTVERRTDEWRRRVAAGHPDSLFIARGGRECWDFTDVVIDTRQRGDEWPPPRGPVIEGIPTIAGAA